MPDYLTGIRVLDREKTGEMSGGNSGTGARAPIFSNLKFEIKHSNTSKNRLESLAPAYAMPSWT
jgi:hypothetical protein